MLLVNYQAVLFGCPESLLTDEDGMREFLTDLAREIEMDTVSSPEVRRIVSDKAPHVGLSGFVIIVQSHIACHSWPEIGTLHITIDSCLPFDGQKATSFSCERFQATSASTSYTEHIVEALTAPVTLTL
jgi:S-adenosylmethionine decarboxylase